MSQNKINLLHSRYNPQGEADRYIASLALNEKIRFFILIEPGLGYIIPPLKQKHPGAKIIALHAEDSGDALIKIPDSEWMPGMGIPIQDFLEREIPDSEAEAIRILEWRPALSVYGEAYRVLVRETVEFIKRADANFRTLKNFGRIWFRNFFKNLDLIKNVLTPASLSRSLIVTGAGPGLEDTIPVIKKAVKEAGAFLLASSSSVAAIQERALAPTMVISTDGGNWAALHLYECFRKGRRGQNPVESGVSPDHSTSFYLAASMNAALPSQCGNVPVLPISDGSLWQTLILKELEIPFIALPQRGTVSASALDLAFALTSGEIYIAGMDLANNDIRSHARPYSFDWLIEEKAGRLNPVYSQTYKRSSLLKEGGSYTIYASWFQKQFCLFPKRLYSLGKNNALFAPLDKSFPFKTMAKSAMKDSTQFDVLTLTHKDKPSLKAMTVLKKLLADPEYSEKVKEELGALLFPGKGPCSHKDLIDGIFSLAKIPTTPLEADKG